MRPRRGSLPSRNTGQIRKTGPGRHCSQPNTKIPDRVKLSGRPLFGRCRAGRTTFVSLMSHQGVAIEEIARLVGHASTRTTEIVYRCELRPVITTGAQIMDQLFTAT